MDYGWGCLCTSCSRRVSEPFSVSMSWSLRLCFSCLFLPRTQQSPFAAFGYLFSARFLLVFLSAYRYSFTCGSACLMQGRLSNQQMESTPRDLFTGLLL